MAKAGPRRAGLIATQILGVAWCRFVLQLPPVVISTPLKLLLFLMVDGWHLLIGALMRSFT